VKIVQQMQDPVPLSIAEVAADEDAFSSYKSAPGNYSRGIERAGKGPPKVLWNDPPHYVDHAHAQSRGGWFIRGNDQGPGLVTKGNRGCMRRGTGGSAPRFSADGWATPSGIAMMPNFRFEITAMLGSGDLPIDYWNVDRVSMEACQKSARCITPLRILFFRSAIGHCYSLEKRGSYDN
jgi:hypothetical protein